MRSVNVPLESEEQINFVRWLEIKASKSFGSIKDAVLYRDKVLSE